jgi:hypothetical protein
MYPPQFIHDRIEYIMSNPYRYLKNTNSGVVSEFDDETAERYLKHPLYKHFLVEVESPKNEVLSQPYEVDDDGERKSIDDSPVSVTLDGEKIAESIATAKENKK